jgi:hypothetical protein
MYIKPIKAMFTAVSMLFRNWRALLIMIAAYVGLLTAVYVFVVTREATIFQLVLTLLAVIATPTLFFVLQAVSVSYADGRRSLRTAMLDGLKLIVVSVPVIAFAVGGVYGLSKVQSHVTAATTLRYLLIGAIAPLLTIQLWVATSNGGLRSLVKSLRSVLTKTFAPESVFVYACGFLIFGVAPYFLLYRTSSIQRPWLELSVMIVRLGASALLILVGWVATVGALSILSRPGDSLTWST